MKSLFSLFWTFLSILPAYADSNNQIETVCLKVKNTPTPKLVSAMNPSAFQKQNCSDIDGTHCKANLLYYGVSGPKNYELAQLAAHLEQKGTNPSIRCAEVTQGSGVLMMIYANGFGVERNYDYALHLACEGAGAHHPEETKKQIQTLIDLRAKFLEKKKTPIFDVCDQALNSDTYLCCEEQINEINEAARIEKIKELSQNWSQSEKKALTRLLVKADEFFSLTSEFEIPSGLYRYALRLELTNKMKNDFQQFFSEIRSEKLPKYSTTEWENADKELNEVYKKLFKSNHFQTIKSTQRAWLTYRDAWVALIKKKFPAISETSLKTSLTLKRSAALRTYLKDES